MRNKKKKADTEDIKIYPAVLPDRMHGVFTPQTGSNSSEQFRMTNTVRPSDDTISMDRQ